MTVIDEDVRDRWHGSGACDCRVVLTADPFTGEIDAHGPLPGWAAAADAAARRRELDAEGLQDVLVSVVRLHH